MTNQAVVVKDLHFKYATAPSLFDGFEIQINEGQRFGIFGPNGAGKTTLMSIITGILPLVDGSITIFDHDLKQEKKKAQSLIGFVPQDFSFYDVLTPMENLEFFGIWSNVDKKKINALSKDILQVLGLYEVRNKNVRRFSGGMKRRVNLAIGVIHHPKILFLDEPTTGVDVQSRHAILEFLLKLNREGTTIVYTSHHYARQRICATMSP